MYTRYYIILYCKAARACKLRHFVMLSAVCVQRPLLAIQEAKLKAEAEIRY